MMRSRSLLTLAFVAAALALAACVCPLLSLPVNMPDTSVLDVDIDYTGTWYRETFDYSRDAKTSGISCWCCRKAKQAGLNPAGFSPVSCLNPAV